MYTTVEKLLRKISLEMRAEASRKASKKDLQHRDWKKQTNNSGHHCHLPEMTQNPEH